jgi:hypothetical protein
MTCFVVGNHETSFYCDSQMPKGIAHVAKEEERDVQKPTTKVPSFKPPCACFNLMVSTYFKVQSLWQMT